MKYLLALYFVIGTVSAQTRQWGFEKDTINNWKSDSITVINNSEDILVIDSSRMWMVSSPAIFDGSFYFNFNALALSDTTLVGIFEAVIQDSALHSNSYLNIPPKSKTSYGSLNLSECYVQNFNDEKDTLEIAAEFDASNGTKDTLYVEGGYNPVLPVDGASPYSALNNTCSPIAIKVFKSNLAHTNTRSLLYDVSGRKYRTPELEKNYLIMNF